MASLWRTEMSLASAAPPPPAKYLAARRLASRNCSKPAGKWAAARLSGPVAAVDVSFCALDFEKAYLRRGVVVSGVRRMNEVNPRWVRLVLGWVTVFGRAYHANKCKSTLTTAQNMLIANVEEKRVRIHIK